MIRAHRIVFIVVLVVVSAIAAGAVAANAVRERPRALERPASAKDALPANTRAFPGLEAGESRLAVRFTAADGGARGVHVTRTRDGAMTCLWDTDLVTGAQGGGCNPSHDFFGGRRLVISLAYDGGPAIQSVASARIVGVVADGVAVVEILNSNGKTRRVPITADRAFAYVVPPNELRQGTGPVAVLARNSVGVEIDRQATGIG